jgi:ParB family chromosome partitioning protein
MTDITNIPLNKLAQFEGNVRKTQNKGFIDELAASIRAHGLQQNLIVKKEGKNFAVVAGSQRLKALLQLAKAGDIRPTHPVPCKIADSDIDASEISLVENVMRDDMHPADEFEAFRDLIDKGLPIPDIAARFGLSETVVMQRLKLARVSPAVLKAYRDKKLTLEQVMAFAVSDDHAAQEHVLENLHPNNRDPRTIRDALTENEIAASDRRVKFVTLKAYEKAGGATRRDLFSAGEDSVFILDAALLDTLAAAKLERAAKPVAEEGWKWLEIHPAFGYEYKAQYQRLYAQPAPLTASEQKKLDKLQEENEKLTDEWSESDDDQKYPERLDELERLIAEFEDREGVWTPEQLAMAGAVVTIGDDGKAHIERGLARPEDVPTKKAKAKSGNSSGPDEAAADDEQSPALSAALVESLTAHKSAALAAELVQRSDIALATVVHAFASRVLLDGVSGENVLQIAVSPQSLHRVEGSKALGQMEAARQKWGGKIPADAGGLWTWCLEQKQAVLLDLLAFCTAASIDAVQGKSHRPESERLRHADKLAAAVGLDMKPWFTPDAANYFSRVSKPQIFEALREAKGQPPAPAWEKLKKAELAQEAERQLAKTGWLPALLRPTA